MSAPESFFITRAKRLFGHGQRYADGTAVAANPTNNRSGLAAQARQLLLEAIGGFFSAHDLHLNGRRLMLVHELLDGRDSWLKDRYDERKQLGLAINDQWLDQIDIDYAQQNRSQLDQLMAEFECQVSQFAVNARDTRLAAEGYETKLTDVAAGNHDKTSTPEGLARLAQQMIEQTRDLVLTMKSSEQYTQGLQQRLEQAKLASETDTLVSVRARGVIFGGDLGAAGGGACPTTSSFDLGGHRAHR